MKTARRVLAIVTLTAGIVFLSNSSCDSDDSNDDPSGTCIDCTTDNYPSVCPSYTRTVGNQTISGKGCAFYTPCNRNCCLAAQDPTCK